MSIITPLSLSRNGSISKLPRPTSVLMDVATFSAPLELFGRQIQFQQLAQALARNRNVLVAGVPGSGRRTLVRRAVAEVEGKILEVDCIRATDGPRLIQLFCEGISQAVKSPAGVAFLQEWMNNVAVEFLNLPLAQSGNSRLQLKPDLVPEQLWQVYELLLQFPQQLATSVQRQVVLVLHGFPHIRSWDRNGEWEQLLLDTICQQTAVSYVLVTTIAETSLPKADLSKDLTVVQLTPLADEVVAAWAQDVLHQEKLSFDLRSQALERFLSAVQGHIGDASSVVRRLQTIRKSTHLIGNIEIETVLQELLTDLSTVFESLLVLLPSSQAQLLESLALDPTDKPQSRDYVNKHHLCRGGSLQGAIAGLQHKGLIYGPELGYQLALPLFALWIRQRLS
ncbi:MAG: ATP-binding protein [Microcoleaceae cyanobacterium]